MWFPILFLLLLSLPSLRSEFEVDEAMGVKNVKVMDQKIKDDIDRISWVSDQLQKDKQKLQTENPSHSNSDQLKKLDYLAEDISIIQNDMAALLNTLNETDNELKVEQQKVKKAEEDIELHIVKEEASKIIEDIQEGKIKIDYETGKIAAKEETTTNVNPLDPLGVLGSTPSKTDKSKEGDTIALIESDIEEWAKKVQKKGENATKVVEDTKLMESVAAEHEEEYSKWASSSTKNPNSKFKDAPPKPPSFPQPETTTEEAHATLVAEKVLTEISKLKTAADPAVMQVSMPLLKDIVTLAITAATFGILAAYLGLPTTAGFLVGGMVIGPSYMALVDNVKEVQTLSQFGCIFLLFEQGLVYSLEYSRRLEDKKDLENGAEGEDNMDVNNIKNINNINPLLKSPLPTTVIKGSNGKGNPSRVYHQATSHSTSRLNRTLQNHTNFAGLYLFVLLAVIAWIGLSIMGSTQTNTELFIVGMSIALTSSTVVSESLHAAHLKESVWGRSALKLVAVQDLIMIPLLALPDVMHSVIEAEHENAEEKNREIINDGYKHLFWRFAAILIFVRISSWGAKHLIFVAYKADKGWGGPEGELFTLSVVAYALTMATFTEEVELSLESGALFAGIILMKSPHIAQVLTAIRPVTSVFGGMYLTSLGMIISPLFLFNKLWTIMTLVFLVGGVKLVVAADVVGRLGYSRSVSVGLSSSMAQISEGSLVLLAKAQRLGFVSRQTYLTLIPVCCILLSLSPFSSTIMKRLKTTGGVGHGGGHGHDHGHGEGEKEMQQQEMLNGVYGGGGGRKRLGRQKSSDSFSEDLNGGGGGNIGV
ncbi:hypothetical protein TrLO_g15708 [Triparma laevis f. longispina]|uniref:Cytochrome oxidase subunit II transmembrane region profile domain-containing protein n=1 Tax=Triparma laevis f. longispina TaxID=1714387 RepID=A0A9W7KVF4_9STRA|nr:hypothetical protein TrLO_g15708 [Triparma laevis f. longispina]